MKLMNIDAAVEVPGDQIEEATAWRPTPRTSKRARRRLARARAALRDMSARGLDVGKLEAILAPAAAK